MRGELLAPDARAWEGLLERTTHDFYHLPAYVQLIARQTGGQPVALHVLDDDSEILLPLVIRPIPGGGWDATSPYGYPGPLLVGRNAAAPGFLRDALIAGGDFLADQGVVSLFVRSHPLIDRVPPSGPGAIVRHGETVVVDLSLSRDELWHQTRHDHRRQINGSKRTGYRVVFDAQWVRESDFRRIYRETMQRLSADSFYLFDDAYFTGLRQALGERLHLVTVETDGEVAAAGLFTEVCGIVQFHLSGTDERYLRAGPTKLLLHEVRDWARRRGDRWFHLGGGLGAADDSLFQFKAGFSRTRASYFTQRVVLREEDYRALVAARAFPNDPDLTGFFPAYRAPRESV